MRIEVWNFFYTFFFFASFNLFVFNNSFRSDFVCDNNQHSIKYGFFFFSFECDFSSKHQLLYRIKITAEPANDIEKEKKNDKVRKNIHMAQMYIFWKWMKTTFKKKYSASNTYSQSPVIYWIVVWCLVSVSILLLLLLLSFRA